MSIEKNLWEAANQLRANSKLKASEYASPVLGLIFLKFADFKFASLEKKFLEKSLKKRKVSKDDYLAENVMYLSDKSRFNFLLNLPESENVGQRINDSMKSIESDNPDLKNTLPKIYNKLSNQLNIELLRLIDNIPKNIEGDAFGKIYEYFLGKFAMSEGKRGGEFFTPTSVVKLIVEIIEPFEGRIFDPACGSGGMFVQSAKFVEKHKLNPSKKISIYGQEKEEETVKLNKMNLAVHGLAGDIRQGITYYEDLHNSINKFDYVMANPPFNVSGVNKDKIKQDKRFSLGIPTNDNANYLWMQIFYNSLKKNGRAGFVMTNSAADASGSELEIRKKLIISNNLDAIISIGPNFFYTVTLATSIWFFNKGKKNKKDSNKILFVDARDIYTEIDRAHREFSEKQIEFLSNIFRSYRNQKIENLYNSKPMFLEKFKNGKYKDVPGLCKAVTIDEIKKKNWSLNSGLYVGVKKIKSKNNNYEQDLNLYKNELENLNKESKELEQKIILNIKNILGK
jgi:type I restriction enzyme M protein